MGHLLGLTVAALGPGHEKFRGKLLRGCLGRPAGAGWGHGVSWGQASLESGAVAQTHFDCGKSRGKVSKCKP